MSRNVYEEGLQEVPSRVLVPHPKNRKFSTTSTEFKSLVESIRLKGVITPIIARPIADGRHAEVLQILAGHRRHSASLAADLDMVPCIVREMDDKAAIEMVWCENREREGLTPLDEAHGIEDMLEAGWDLESIGSRMGLSTSVLAKRRALLQLTPAWQDLISDPEHPAANAPTGVIERIARLPVDVQNDLANEVKRRDQAVYCEWLVSVDCFKSEVESNRLFELRSACWKLDDAMLLPKAGACSQCPNRSNAQPLLWDGDLTEKKGQQVDRCLNAACFNAKKLKALELRVAEKKEEHPKLVVLTGWHDHDIKIPGVKTAQEHNYRTCKKEDKGAIPAITLKNPKSIKWVRSHNAEYADSESNRSKQSAGEDGQPSLKDKRAELERRRMAWVVSRVRDQLQEISNSENSQDPKKLKPLKGIHVYEEPAEGLKGAGRKVDPWEANQHQLVCLAAIFGTFGNLQSLDEMREEMAKCKTAWDQARRLMTIKPQEAAVMLLRDIAGVLQSRLVFYTNQGIEDFFADARESAQLFMIDFDGLVAEAVIEIPEPKSWAKLNADGTPKKSGSKPSLQNAAKSMAKSREAYYEQDIPVGESGNSKVYELVGKKCKPKKGATKKTRPLMADRPPDIAVGTLDPDAGHKTYKTITVPLCSKRNLLEIRVSDLTGGYAAEYTCKQGSNVHEGEVNDADIYFECEEDAVIAAISLIADCIWSKKIRVDLEKFEAEYTKDWECSECGRGSSDCEWVTKNLCRECEGKELDEDERQFIEEDDEFGSDLLQMQSAIRLKPGRNHRQVREGQRQS